MSFEGAGFMQRIREYDDALNAGSSCNPDMAHLLRVSACVGDMAETPDDTFVIGLRAKLIHEASNVPVAGKRAHYSETQQARRPRCVPAQRPRRKIGAVVASTVVALGSMGVLGGSVNALPGQALYQVKRSFENSRIALADNPVTLGERHLDLAARRLDEVASLANASEAAPNAQLISQTLSVFASETTEGAKTLFEAYGESHENEIIEKVTTSLSASSESLRSISDVLPDESAQAYETAAKIVRDLYAQAANICSDCSMEPLADLPPTLSAGAGETSEDLDGYFHSAAKSTDSTPQRGTPEKPSKSPTTHHSPTNDHSASPQPSDSPGGQSESEHNQSNRGAQDDDNESNESNAETAGPLKRLFSPLSKGLESLVEKHDPEVNGGDKNE